MTDEQLRVLVRQTVIEVLREYLSTERESQLLRVDAIERMLAYNLRTSQLRKDAREAKIAPVVSAESRLDIEGKI